MITALFLRDSDWSSNLIAWGTQRPGQERALVPSHVAFLFEFNGNRIVIESDIADGVQLATYDEAIGTNKLIAAIELGLSEEESYRRFESAKKEFVGKWYDVFGIAYFSWRIALFKAFGTPIPTKNRWGFKKMYFCSEFYTAIVGGRPQEYGMVSPNDLMLVLLEKRYDVIEGLLKLPV